MLLKTNEQLIKVPKKPSEENFETYKIKRNMAKTVSKTHKESWDRFICGREADIFGEQNMAYKVLKHLNRTNNDTIEINNIEDKNGKNNITFMVFKFPAKQNDEPETTLTPSTEIDEISDEELEQSLKSTKKQESSRSRGFKF